jgi:hypothetical protein
MNIFGFDVPGFIVVIILVLAASVLADRAEAGEEDKNERITPPSKQQVAWHIRHTRQDIRLANILLAAILMTLWIKF